jgi:hypothetical protein
MRLTREEARILNKNMHLTTIIKNGGFDYQGVWITDIYSDETGRFQVNPEQYYNIDLSK